MVAIQGLPKNSYQATGDAGSTIAGSEISRATNYTNACNLGVLTSSSSCQTSHAIYVQMSSPRWRLRCQQWLLLHPYSSIESLFP